MDRRIYFVASFFVMVSVLGIFLITRPLPGRKIQQLSPQATQSQSTPQVLSVAAYACQKGKTALEILQDMAKVETQGSGQIVTAINGSSQSEDKRWVYTVDNKEATISASSYTCLGEEVIRWELKSL